MPELILWIFFGGLVGWIAALVFRTQEMLDTKTHVTVGVLGAVIGGVLIKNFTTPGITSVNFTSVVAAVVAAILAIGLLHLLRRH